MDVPGDQDLEPFNAAVDNWNREESNYQWAFNAAVYDPENYSKRMILPETISSPRLPTPRGTISNATTLAIFTGKTTPST
jgi:hypothetical protein